MINLSKLIYQFITMLIKCKFLFVCITIIFTIQFSYIYSYPTILIQKTFSDNVNSQLRDSLDWKVYKSETWGVQFSYPTYCILDSTYETVYVDDGIGLIHLYDSLTYQWIQDEKPEYYAMGPKFQINIQVNPKNSRVLDWLKQNDENFDENYSKMDIDESSLIVYEWEGLIKGITAVQKLNQPNYIIAGDMDIELLKNDFFKIISSIKKI